MDLFGFSLVRNKADIKAEENKPSIIPKDVDDGAVVVAPSGSYGTYVDLDGSIRSEAELITRYREMAVNAEIDAAVDEIVNEAISVEEEDTVKIILDDINATDPIKEAIQSAFEEVLRLLNFNNQAYDIIRRWYIDGRLYYHLVIDMTKATDGIVELRYIDPRKIRKIREVIKKRTKDAANLGPEGIVVQVKNEYYLFNEKGFNLGQREQSQGVNSAASGVKIAADAIAHCTSGLTDVGGTMILSYLHKAIKPLNQLRAIEDSAVIYRLARAPERRVWYIDVGNLPKMKAEQYVRDIMTKHKNRLVYDSATGAIRDDRKFMTMLEDYWLPRREGGKGTEVETLPGGENLGEMEDVLYFQKKLYSSLNVPINRLNSDALFSIGRATEVTRDEVKFGKFIARLRNRFGQLFTKILERQIVLKQIMSIEDWKRLAPQIKYDFAHDNYWMELKNQEIQQNRMDVLEATSQWIGRFYSNKWITKHILGQSEEDVKEMKEQIMEEETDPIYSQPLPGQMDPMMDGMAPMGPDVDMPMMPGQEGQDEEEVDGDSQSNVDTKPGEQKVPNVKTQQRRDPKKKKLPFGNKPNQ